MRILIALLLLCSTVSAGVPTLIIDAQGRYFFSAGDETQAVQIDNVVRLPGAPDTPDVNTPVPNPTPHPQPPQSDIATKVKQWSAQINDPIGAKILGQVYALIGQQIQAGKIPGDFESVRVAFKEATERALKTVAAYSEKEAEWREFDEKLTQELSLAFLSNPAAVGPMLLDAGSTLQPPDAALPAWLAPIIQILIDILLKWIQTRFGG